MKSNMTPLYQSSSSATNRDGIIAFIDSETSQDGNVYDFGALSSNGNRFHERNPIAFKHFISNAQFLCGHNIVAHDLTHIEKIVGKLQHLRIDTLLLASLFLSNSRSHALSKDEKNPEKGKNNPYIDSEKAKDLFEEIKSVFLSLPLERQKLYASLLYNFEGFNGFFVFLNITVLTNTSQAIREQFQERICENAPIDNLVLHFPIETAFALSLIDDKNFRFLPSLWAQKKYPNIEVVLRQLRNTPCEKHCTYCNSFLNLSVKLKRIFGFDQFRTYDGEPLQEQAAQSAINDESLLVIFPTGGGKSLTFQLPALMQGESNNNLTIIISPLQSLMKDQIDHLINIGIDSAVSINSSLNPLERSNAFDAIFSGKASILYIAPEQLRSRTVRKAIESRSVSRFVIDEAHCFSAWGHDFRVDYLYIADFIKKLQTTKGPNCHISVSCFTATAKQKVIQDICDYFKTKLNLNLKLFTSHSTRKNLSYKVSFEEDDNKKYSTVRSLIETNQCPTIVYVSRTKVAEEIAERLSVDGIKALPYHGKLNTDIRKKNQEDFLTGEVDVMVATTAFGMGVDKKDVGLVIHHDISSSLENYVQEAGRAGRDPNLQASCHVLFNEKDLDAHFSLITQSKLTLAEIQQVWKAIKSLSKTKYTFSISPLQLARLAGWDREDIDITTQIKAVLNALEMAGYIQREENCPRIYGTSLRVFSITEAAKLIDSNENFFSSENEKTIAKRIFSSLITSFYTNQLQEEPPTSQVDYLADRLGLTLKEVLNCITQLRQIGIIQDKADLEVSLPSKRKSSSELSNSLELEKFIIQYIFAQNLKDIDINLKELNSSALVKNLGFSTIKSLKTIFLNFQDEKFIKHLHFSLNQHVSFELIENKGKFLASHNKRFDLAGAILNEILNISLQDNEKIIFSLLSIATALKGTIPPIEASSKDIENTLLYLSKIGTIHIEGGFMVLYNTLSIKRLITDNKKRYVQADYHQLDEYYRQKIQQVHIVGKYANLMVENYSSALEYVNDYFHLDYQDFIKKYFKNEEGNSLKRNMTSQQYRKLFGGLSTIQRAIIDDRSQHIVVAAGPGSGKTKVLVHKLASLLLQEDVHAEQLLMVTFSRAAATEFKLRLLDLIGKLAFRVDIKTFHSYAFDLVGTVGSLADSQDIIPRATTMIKNNLVEQDRITKSVLVIDEAQDMSLEEFQLVEALIERNETMRVIAVGDDDQNIYEFRGSDSKYFRSFICHYDATRFELNDNYRSCKAIVSLANNFSKLISNRMKEKPIASVKKELGSISITRYKSNSIEAALVEEIMHLKITGKTAILTQTNEEAFCIYGLLTNAGVKAHLIQSHSNLRVYNLHEVRSLLWLLEKNIEQNHFVLKEKWDATLRQFEAAFKTSTNYPFIQYLLSQFKKSNQEKFYFSDLKEFLCESNFEDISLDKDNGIVVSTIHKSKGSEFDNVWLLLKDIPCLTDEILRCYYVGLTRAKTNLFIHTKDKFFERYQDLPGCHYQVNNVLYPQPNELAFSISLDGINLGFSDERTRQNILKTKRCGCQLDYLNKSISSEEKEIARFSKFTKTKIDNLEEKGWIVDHIILSNLVYWKDKKTEKEILIPIPTIYLTKHLYT